MTSDLPYRLCAGVVLANTDGLIFTGERTDTPGAWQMPQGGVDEGETPEMAAIRELEEETGIAPGLVTVEAELPKKLRYDLPPHLLGKMWKGRYRGQEQSWFLLRFHGTDSDIDIAKNHHEFGRWRWSTPADVLRDIVPFKREVYRAVIAGFAGRFSG